MAMRTGRVAHALGGLCAAGICAGYSNMVHAQTCVSSNVDHYVDDARRKFLVSSTTDDNLSGVTAIEFQRAAAMAAATWNNQTNSRPFVYSGTTALTDLPADKADCDADGIDYSLVVVDNVTNTSSKGQAEGRCENAAGKATQFLITIYANDEDGNARNWEASGDTIGATEFDLLQTMTHEMGHTLHLGHPPAGEYGTMNPTSQGTSKQRDLYQWDVTCVRDLPEAPSDRGTHLRRRWHSASTFAAEETPFPDVTQASGSSGLSWLDGTTSFAVAAKQTGGSPTLWWARTSIQTFSSTDNDLAAQVTEATFREDTAQSRVFWVTPAEYPTALDAGSSPRISYKRSSNGFVSTNWGTLEECATMTGFMTCTSHDPIRSSKELAVGWDSSVSRTVLAWVNQNRANNAAQREIRIAVGYLDNYLLPMATATGLQSNVSPGVACRTGAADGYNCLLAYVSQSDGTHKIQVRRFTPVADATHYSLSWHPTTTQLSWPTASRIAVWYHDGKWWVAYRTSNSGQKVWALSSSDSLTWSAPEEIGYSDVGPTAAAYWTGNNMLYFAN